jgi:hypothetical protein
MQIHSTSHVHFTWFFYREGMKVDGGGGRQVVEEGGQVVEEGGQEREGGEDPLQMLATLFNEFHIGRENDSFETRLATLRELLTLFWYFEVDNAGDAVGARIHAVQGKMSIVEALFC